jgi:proline dehydrogenase
MFRSFFVYLSKAAWARKIVTQWKIARLMSNRFVAGEKLEDAIRVIYDLNQRGIQATLDHLGEHTTTPDESRRAVLDIIQALDAIQESGVRANVSIKLTQIGLSLDDNLCEENLNTIMERASALDNFIRIDMEDSPVTQVTLDLLMKMHQAGFKNVGIVIQSYLYRSEKDICDLVDTGISVRLCKGAYKEPAQVAYPKKSAVDLAYDHLSDILLHAAQKPDSTRLRADGRFPPLPAFATHDERRIAHVKTRADEIGLPKDALEFQMLYGIRRDLQENLAAEGYPVRIYVPYGLEWYPYFMRRLGERPANLWFILSNYFRR